MRHTAVLALALGGALLASGCERAPGDEQAMVDRATLTVQEMMTSLGDAPQDMLRKARAVMICPRVFKAGFFAGGEGGGCVLVSRSGNGTWSYPAFYAMGSGSFGLQIGIQDAQLVLMILTDKGLNAVLDSQMKLGANAGIAIATVGAGVQGSTTTAVGADIVAFAMSRGLYGGIALEGSVMSTRTEWNQGYYGQPFAARQIVVQMQGMNPGADPLRQVLTRWGAAGTPGDASRVATPAMQDLPGGAPIPPTAAAGTTATPTPATPATAAPPPAAPAPSQGLAVPPGARGPLQEQQLAPPGR